MTRTSRALRAVTDVACAALQAPASADPLEFVAAELVRVLDVDACILEMHDLEHGVSVIQRACPPSVWQQLPIVRIPTVELIKRNPASNYFITSGVDRPFAVSDVVPVHAWRTSDFAVMLRPGFGRALMLGIPMSPQSRTLYSWAGSRDGHDYGAADLDVAQAVQPVLDAVLRQATAAASCAVGTGARNGLTHREVVVLGLIAEGLGAQAIGRRLGTSPRTVSKHAEHVYRKLGVRDRLLAVRVATELGILPRSGQQAATPVPIAEPHSVGR